MFCPLPCSLTNYVAISHSVPLCQCSPWANCSW